MTDTPTPAASTPAATPTTNSAPAAPAAAATQNTPSGDAQTDTAASSVTNDKADGSNNSGEDAPAQGADQPDTDKADQPNQSSDEPNAEDAQEGDEGEGEEDGNQEAQEPQYEPFTMPEGVEIDQRALDEALPVLQALKADQQQAQSLVDIGASLVSNALKNITDQHNTQVATWKGETLKQFGADGDAKFQERAGRAEEVIRQFFPTEENKQVLTHYGIGNHPSIFAMALAIAEATGEDRPSFNLANNGTNGNETLAEVWYPNKT